MTNEEFLQELAALPKTGWRLTKKGLLRNGNYCPITYLAKAKLGIKYKVDEVAIARDKLGLDFWDNTLVFAADNISSFSNTINSIRNKLLKTLGFSE